MQLQSRIPCPWFTRKTLLSTQHLNFLGCPILLDNPEPLAAVVQQVLLTKWKSICKHLVLYLPSRIWPCCLSLSSTYSTYFGLCLLNLSCSDLTARLIESTRCFQRPLLFFLKHLMRLTRYQLPGTYWSPNKQVRPQYI